MATLKKLSVGAINITMHPHKPADYVKLIRAAAKHTASVKLRSDLSGRIANITKLDHKVYPSPDMAPISGDIFKYIDIDLKGNWYDIQTKGIASDRDKETIHIPEQLKPNLSILSFIFYPDTHLLVYQSYETSNRLTPNYAEKIIRESLNSPDLQAKYGIINVTHLPETDLVDELVELKKITTVSLETRRPNPDTLQNAERKFHARMERINAKTEIRTYKSDDQEVLSPDSELKNEIRIAARNGVATISHIDENDRNITHTTKAHPLQRTDYYDPNKVNLYTIFKDLADKIKTEMYNWID